MKNGEETQKPKKRLAMKPKSPKEEGGVN